MTKITNFNIIIFIYKNIQWFEISMNNSRIMNLENTYK